MSRFASRLFLSPLLAILLFAFTPTPAFAQQAKTTAAAKRWADSIYNRLSADERIGQLFMVAAYSGGPKFNQDSIES